MIRVEGLRAGQGGFVLRAAFDVPQGRRVAVAGPSGAGKSTLLGVLGGYTRVFAGKILINGVDVTEAAPDARGIAMLFQDGNLFPHLSIAQNVGLGVRPSLRLSGTEMARVAQALERVGLADLAARKPGALSGGQQSRAALARALLQSSPVLLLDEPFAGVDPISVGDIRSLVADLKTRGIGVLITDHNVRETLEIVDRAYILHEGQVLMSGTPGEVVQNENVLFSQYRNIGPE